ncbi:MAG: glucuronyl hydrolase, partial [Rikenellaceae bacterium]
MKKVIISAAILIFAIFTANAQEKLIKKSVDFSAEQMKLMVQQVDTFSKIPSPRTTAKDRKSTGYTTLNDWTSGFFPGSLWYLYELTDDKSWLPSAVKYTEGMEHIKNFTGN